MTIKQGQRGLLFILVGPGGAGKNTLMRAALARYAGLRQLATATTRPMRDGEQDGREHLFINKARFKQMIADGELLEWQEVTPDKFYGVPRDSVETNLAEGLDLIADIEVLGAKDVRDAFPKDVVLVFVTVPGQTEQDKLDVLRERMSSEDRNEPEKLIRQRLDRAETLELPFADECTHVIVNDDAERAAQELIDLIQQYQRQRATQDDDE